MIMTTSKKKPDRNFDPEKMNELFGLTIVKTIRIPKDLFEQVEAAAQKQGGTFNDAVANALRTYLGLPQEEVAAFIRKVCDWVVATFPSDDFPENVTHLVFKHIWDAPDLLKEYRALTEMEEMKNTVNRRLGKMVKNALNATVIGRSLPLTGEGELITTYALLRPTMK